MVNLRGPKIGNMAIFDFAAVLSVSFLIAKNITDSILLFLILVIVGVFTHILFGIPTMLNYYLGFNDYESVIKNRNKAEAKS
jgi:hypothetical protein